jgi:hypothetical protein
MPKSHCGTCTTSTDGAVKACPICGTTFDFECSSCGDCYSQGQSPCTSCGSAREARGGSIGAWQPLNVEKPQFTHLRFLSLNTKTLQPFTPNGAKDVASDIHLRTLQILNAVNECLSKLKGAADPSVLNILVLPEFYFRFAKGDYTYADYLKAWVYIQEQFAAEKYRNWLLCCGTMVSQEPSAAQANANAGAAARVGFNTVLVLRGGGGKAFAYEKHSFSNIDGMAHLVPGKDEAAVNPLIAEYMAACTVPWFKVDGMVFGIEICLDHRLGVLKSRAKGYVDIHLLTACGMPCQPENVVTADGGYFFRCDGHPQFLGTELSRVKRTGFATQVTGMNKGKLTELGKFSLAVKDDLVLCCSDIVPRVAHFRAMDIAAIPELASGAAPAKKAAPVNAADNGAAASMTAAAPMSAAPAAMNAAANVAPLVRNEMKIAFNFAMPQPNKPQPNKPRQCGGCGAPFNAFLDQGKKCSKCGGAFV